MVEAPVPQPKQVVETMVVEKKNENSFVSNDRSALRVFVQRLAQSIRFGGLCFRRDVRFLNAERIS